MYFTAISDVCSHIFLVKSTDCFLVQPVLKKNLSIWRRMHPTRNLSQPTSYKCEKNQMNMCHFFRR